MSLCGCMHVNTVSQRPGGQSLCELGFQGVVNCLSWVLRTKLGPLQEQCLLLPAEPIFQSPATLFFFKGKKHGTGEMTK